MGSSENYWRCQQQEDNCNLVRALREKPYIWCIGRSAVIHGGDTAGRQGVIHGRDRLVTAVNCVLSSSTTSLQYKCLVLQISHLAGVSPTNRHTKRQGQRQKDKEKDKKTRKKTKRQGKRHKDNEKDKKTRTKTFRKHPQRAIRDL